MEEKTKRRRYEKGERSGERKEDNDTIY